MASPLHYLDDPQAWERERAAFVEAALALLARSDAVDLQVAEVVRLAGRHNASFYRVFGSKEGLTLAVVQEAARRTAAVVERRLRRIDEPAQAVRTWARTLLALAAVGGDGVQALAIDRYRLMRRFPEADDSIIQPLRRPLEDVLRGAGRPRPALLADAALELVMSRQAAWIAVRHRPSARELDAYAGLVVHLVGLGSAAGAGLDGGGTGT